MVEVALKFGPAEYFALMVFAFVTVAAVLGQLDRARPDEPVPRAAASAWSASTARPAQTRFAFGVPELLDGIDVVVLAVGLFAVGEALYVAAYQSRLHRRRSRRCRARS